MKNLKRPVRERPVHFLWFKRSTLHMASAYVMVLLPWLVQTPLAKAQSLPDLYIRALARDPAVAGAEAQLHAAEQRHVQARASFGPTAALVGNYNETRYREAPKYEQRKFQGKQLNLQITQPLLRSALFPALDSAEAQLYQAQAALDQARADSAQRLVEACFEVLKARDALDLARAQRVSTAEQLMLAQRSFKIGTAPIIDVREAEAKADSVAAQVSAAEFELDLRLQIVAELTGQTASTLLTRGLDGKHLPPLEAGSASLWLATAQDNSAQLQQARQALLAAEAEVRKAWHGHAPTADLTYTYGRSSDTGTLTTAFPRGGNSSAVGVNLNIPLFASGATHSKVNEARALRDKAQSDVDAARRTISLGVRQNTSATLSAIGQAHGLEAAVRSQELAFRANRRGYEVGMKVNAEVLDSQSRLFEARRDLSRARYDAWAGYIKLKALAGRLDESDISTLDALLVSVAQADMRLPRRQQ
ncbi:TolC family protein [Variovorax sp. V15]|uniref:TolC family protein n=1 Tax=Variovorax sp. V15 TaxID=3065952 RepID=UPI0034E895D6